VVRRAAAALARAGGARLRADLARAALDLAAGARAVRARAPVGLVRHLHLVHHPDVRLDAEYGVVHLDGVDLGAEATAAPYTLAWATITASNGAHSLTAVARDAVGNRTTSAPINVTVATGTSSIPGVPTRSPYKGSAFSVPGLIEAEDFDNGGEGVAYHDLTAGNQGGQYRTGVDVDIITPAPGVYVVNYFQTGEWLSYTINVTQTAIYRLEALVSSAFTTSSWHMELDGVNVTGSVAVPNTGSWATFQWVGVSGVDLTAGQHVLTLVADQQYFNVDAIRLSP